MGFNMTLVTTMLLISLLGLGLIGFLMGNIAASGEELNPEYAAMFNAASGSTDIYLTQQEIIEGGTINPEGFDLAITKDVIVSFKSFQSAGEVAVNMTRQMGNAIGLTGGVQTILFSLILIASLGGVFYAIVGRKP